jgi:hypothetical protein
MDKQTNKRMVIIITIKNTNQSKKRMCQSEKRREEKREEQKHARERVEQEHELSS